jgi:hypothetical protein
MMSSMYGHKWTSAYGLEVDADRVWYACLSDIAPEQIKRGLGACKTLMLDWPPSAPEFRRLCLGLDKNSDPEHVAIAGMHKPFPIMLENKTAQEKAKVVGVSELRKMKGLF